MSTPVNILEKRLMKARAQLLMNQPFFGCLAVHLKPVETADHPAFATDGESLFYNPDYADGLTNAELQGVIAHEVMHVAADHVTRRGNRSMAKWQKACDLAINGPLLEAGFTLPGEPHHDPDLDGLSAEQIYARLPDDKNQNGDQNRDQNAGGGSSGAGCGEALDAAPAHDGAALGAVEARTQAVVRQARMLARKAEGGLSEDLERLIGELTAPKVDWRDILRSFIDDRVQMDFSWMKPNRRFIADGIYLPGQVPDGISHVVLAVDTSGSIDQAALDAFAAEIRAAWEDGAVDNLTIVYADTSVKGHHTLIPGDVFDLTPVGGGGTSFAPTFDWIEEHAPDAVAVIYFTDLKCSTFGTEPACPVLWATWGDPRAFDRLAGKAPFGEAIFISPE
ncbi:MAG: hypothetical protein JJ902_05330 [Roseibium sp.]|nr:hypothetical protein [Roseibium sp.]